MKKIIVLLITMAMLLSVGCSAAVSVVGANINEDGHLVLSMSDGSTIDAGYAKGEDGVDGKDGIDGKDGRDGIDGADGVSIKKAAVNDDGHLMIRLTDDTLIDTGYVVGADGKDGRDGVDGRDGTDGRDGVDGTDGTDGSNGIDGNTPYVGDNGNWWIDGKDTGIEADKTVKSGANGGTNFKLGESGTLYVTVSDNPVPDKNSRKEFDSGEWREAVVYDSNGNALAEGYNRPNATADEGGYPVDRNSVTSITIADGVTSIGSFAAQFPNAAGELVIPASVTYIGQEAFKDLTKITKITFAEGGTEPLCIAPGAFKELGVEEIVLPADRPEIHIHCWAFNDCTNLKRVTLPANITTFKGWTHVDYAGMDYVWSKYPTESQIFARCTKLETMIFGSQEVHDLFFAAPGNTSNINAIGNVEIIINN